MKYRLIGIVNGNFFFKFHGKISLLVSKSIVTFRVGFCYILNKKSYAIIRNISVIINKKEIIKIFDKFYKRDSKVAKKK